MYTETEKPKNDTYFEQKSKYVDSYELADIGTRFGALIIDNILIGIIAGVIAGVSGRNEAGVMMYFLIQTGYQWYFLMNNDGQTPGKKMTHIRVIKVDGSALTSTDVVLRVFGYYINQILFGLGWLTATADSNRQGIQDKLAKTYVVKE